jgi:hypothetical protein
MHGAHARQASSQSARLGSKQTGPLSRTLQQAAPASHTPGLACLYQRPQTLSSTRCRPTAPGIFPARPVPPPALLALPRYLKSFVLSYCHTAVPFVSLGPVCCGTSTSSSLLFRFRIQNVASCMHAPARTEVALPYLGTATPSADARQ